jgi:hypothetical protein
VCAWKSITIGFGAGPFGLVFARFGAALLRVDFAVARVAVFDLARVDVLDLARVGRRDAADVFLRFLADLTTTASLVARR